MPKLEFALDPADIDALIHLDGIRPSRSYPAAVVWFDTPGHDLADAGLAVSASGARCQLAPLRPSTAAATLPVLAEARRPALLSHAALPDVDVSTLQPVARLDGRRQALRWTGPGDATATLQLLHGHLTMPGKDPRPACRLQLDGDAPALATLAASLAAALRMEVPRAGLAEQALRLVGPRALGAPRIHTHQTVTDSLALIIGHLADVILHWSGLIVAAPASRAADPEPVHQMRVATRRLRSALSVYKPAVGAGLASVTVPLKLCATRLGVAREWDVFLVGLGARLVETFPDDSRCGAMMRAAARRRRAAYADLRAYLAGSDFRTLAVTLACTAELRPWQACPASLSQDTAVFAAHVLARRLKRVRRVGKDLANLPVPALHELRKDCKRLRYAAEFFAPSFSAKRAERFLGRLAALQEELGLLNDGAAVAGLMAQLGRLERGYAAGLAEGFSAAHAGPARGRIEHAWRRFRAQPGFWRT